MELCADFRTVGGGQRSQTYENLTWINVYAYTGCPRRNVKYFGGVFLELNYTDITRNTYIQS